MKRFMAVIMAMLCTLSVSVFAMQPGDVAGQYYYTDIRTYMKDAPITAYNIGGRTCIDAEILNWHYGFDVYWYADTRALEITDKGSSFTSLQAQAGDTLEAQDGQPGQPAGDYYYTDIVTTLNGREIEAYNIGGRTVICAEAMRDYGYDVVWDEAARTLHITRAIQTFASDIGEITMQDVYKTPIVYDEAYGHSNYERVNSTLTLDGRQLAVEDPHHLQNIVSVLSPYYVPVGDILRAVGASIQWDDATRTLTAAYDASQPLPTTDLPADTTAHAASGDLYILYDFHLVVNGQEYENLTGLIPSVANPMAEPSRRSADVFLYDGKVYITANTAADILGYSLNGMELVQP